MHEWPGSFSGIGGISFALKPWVRTIAYCEQDRYSQAVLLSRMWNGELCHAPIWDDVQTLRGDSLGGWVDIIFGGFPCQDISVAGGGAGLEGERSGLFLHVARLAEEIRPAFIFLENVPAIRTRGLSVVCDELARLGFDIRWTTVSAAEVGAVHIRKRWFLLAHSNKVRLREERGQEVGWDLAIRKGSLEPHGTRSKRRIAGSPERRTQPRVDRAGDGIPHRLDRHSGLGNSVHIEATEKAFMRLAGIK